MRNSTSRSIPPGSLTGRVEFELVAEKHLGDYLFESRGRPDRCISTRQYSRLVSSWISGISLDPLRRTKATTVGREICVLQLLLGHTKLEGTVRYLGIEVDNALTIAEQVDVWLTGMEQTCSAPLSLAVQCQQRPLASGDAEALAAFNALSPNAMTTTSRTRTTAASRSAPASASPSDLPRDDRRGRRASW
jgi:hypothetical protein